MEPFFASYLKSLEALFADFAQSLEGLPREALDWRPAPDTNSLAVLAVHTAGATRYLLGEVCLGEAPTRDRPAEFVTSGLDSAELGALLQATVAHARAALGQLGMEDLPRRRPMPGRDMEVTIAEALLQALAHAGEHLGHAQITRQLWQQRAR